jgi:hypothetical protein
MHSIVKARTIARRGRMWRATSGSKPAESDLSRPMSINENQQFDPSGSIGDDHHRGREVAA